jgi:putative DNA primase/helicase
MVKAMSDVIRSFTDAMLDAGIVPTCPIIGDGLLHRTYVEGDRAGTLNLAYVLHLDGKPAGWWMYFKTGVTVAWSLSGKHEPMTAAIKRQIADAKAAREQERQKAHQAAKAKAQWC